MDQEQVSPLIRSQAPLIPIVEHLPNGDQPHPRTDEMPEGTIGHPGEHLEHTPVTHYGKVVAAPPGHGEEVETVPSSGEVEKLLKEGEEESGHWLGVELLKKFKKAA